MSGKSYGAAFDCYFSSYLGIGASFTHYTSTYYSDDDEPSFYPLPADYFDRRIDIDCASLALLAHYPLGDVMVAEAGLGGCLVYLPRSSDYAPTVGLHIRMGFEWQIARHFGIVANVFSNIARFKDVEVSDSQGNGISHTHLLFGLRYHF